MSERDVDGTISEKYGIQETKVIRVVSTEAHFQSEFFIHKIMSSQLKI
jgi:hypothetical protein